MSVGKVIRMIRESEMLTQREFAVRIGISQTSVALLEKGKTNPKDETITKVALAFNYHPLLIKFAGIGFQLHEEKEATFKKAFPNFHKRALALIIRC